jgi:protein phosphatase
MVEKNIESLMKAIDNDMSPRFGHTITLGIRTLTLVQKSKAVLFGGATGVDGRFSINSDTYVFYTESKKWVKLERKH